jgi:serine/threonine-protein kinase
MDEGARVKVGEIVADRYRVDRVLGQGAMGVVVAATHVELQQTRAIKFMLPETLDDKESVERFLREARAAAKLTSPHAVKVHDVARLPTGEPYIVMEYLQGTDLKKYLAEKRVLPIPEAVSYILQACDAIAEAHAAGVVHRDLKPANLFLAERAGAPPTLKVLDFGIAKVNDNPSNDGQLTATQTVIGSPLYMSPEQILSTRSVDARSDVWSLGVILYVLVTGMVPFRGDSTLAIFASVQRDDPVPPSMWMPSLPRDLERIILSCLEKDLAKRCPSARDLAAALAPFGPGASQGAGQNRAPAPADIGGTQRMTPALASASRPPAPPAPQGTYSQQPASQEYSNSNRFGSTQALSPGASYPAPPGYPPAPPYPHAGGYSPQPPPSYPNPGYPPAGAGSYAPASVPGYAPAPGSYPHPAPQSYSQAGAQTNSPMTQPVVAPPRGRGRELLLIGGGFATALVIVGAVVIVSGSGNSKEPASNTPETAAAPAPSPPPVSADPPAGGPSVTPSSPETPPESPSGAAKAGSPPSGPATAAKPIGPATPTTTTKPPSAPAPSPPPAATQKPAPTSTTGAPLRKRHD